MNMKLVLWIRVPSPDSIQREQARNLFLDAVLQLRADASSLYAARHSVFTSVCYFQDKRAPHAFISVHLLPHLLFCGSEIASAHMLCSWTVIFSDNSPVGLDPELIHRLLGPEIAQN